MDRKNLIAENSRPAQTLYMSQDDLYTALDIAKAILKGDEIKKNADGFSSIEDVCSLLKSKCPRLSYINRNHVVELYFKDESRKIFISGQDFVKHKQVQYVTPPDQLYFGTLKHLTCYMRSHGIKSSTKGYLKLYDTPEGAYAFAKKFVRQNEDIVEVLIIDALGVYRSGLPFTMYKPHEYIVVRIDPKFIVS